MYKTFFAHKFDDLDDLVNSFKTQTTKTHTVEINRLYVNYYRLIQCLVICQKSVWSKNLREKPY